MTVGKLANFKAKGFVSDEKAVVTYPANHTN